MPGLPVRVAVVSPHALIRHGLVGLIAQLGDRAVVTEAVTVDHDLLSHDVAIYDVGEVVEPDAYNDLQTLLAGDVQVITLVYGQSRNALPAELSDTSQAITLSVTPDRLLEVLELATASGTHTAGDLTRGDLPAGLSARELEVLRLVAGDHSNDDIAKLLYVSPNTVKTYIRTAYRKIGVVNRSGAIHWAIRHGLANDAVQVVADRSASSQAPADAG